MIVHINGWPGVGKYTVGRIVADRLAGHLLDNHTIYNPAFSLTEFRTADFYELVRNVRDVALERVACIPGSTPIVMTNAYSESEWANENWDAILAAARRRKSKHLVVLLDCTLDENMRRVQFPERQLSRKLMDANELSQMRANRKLLSRGADALLRFDNTNVTPAVCAEYIVSWVKDNMGP